MSNIIDNGTIISCTLFVSKRLKAPLSKSSEIILSPEIMRKAEAGKLKKIASDTVSLNLIFLF